MRGGIYLVEVVLCMSPRVDVDVLAISENMFVHNNSKHGRRIKRGSSEPGTVEGEPGAGAAFLPLSHSLSKMAFNPRPSPPFTPFTPRPSQTPSVALPFPPPVIYPQNARTAIRLWALLFLAGNSPDWPSRPQTHLPGGRLVPGGRGDGNPDRRELPRGPAGAVREHRGLVRGGPGGGQEKEGRIN